MATAIDTTDERDMARSEAMPTTTTLEEGLTIHVEHHALRTHAEQLEATLAELASPASVGRQAESLVLLDDFRRRLGAHLVAEEEQGVLEDAAARAPRLARRVEQLRYEHDELRASLDWLIGEAMQSEAKKLHGRFCAFRRLLLLHEEAETEILQCAYLDDLGGED